ncbi:PREDICTED: uncharacterized protein LOC101293399 [Fragaria vesca subsp. vesca]|uniref:uncharacterized protein LOC101293399 n=1 Tax=Fragaria vesca subsp. vesca TaxID=101020 RepID=UPI0002C34897|nr:PREDICTED: uncharacterized protein LOC101293399 [Fragaria vesca subsp. vesca]
MKQGKLTVIVKELSTGYVHPKTTIILSLCVALFLFVLGMFIIVHTTKFLSSEYYSIPQLKTYSPLSPNCTCHAQSHCIFSVSPQLLPISTLPNLSDYIAPKELWHSMSDQELLWRASMAPQVTEYPYNRTPKVAFMFLTKGKLPLAPLWERFFRGHEGFYSVYLHAAPDFKNEPPESSVFYKRMIPSKAVEWGKVTMVEAERRLLANALLDFSNERFVLLSESCIPLFNFTTVYDYLTNSKYSFISSFDDPRGTGRGRYNRRMWPTVTLSDWRKGSQWFEVHRNLALKIVSDVTYFPIFRDLCQPPCYNDEHYLATLVTKVGPGVNSNRSITWADWSIGGPHPATYERRDVNEMFLNQLRHGFNCTYNGGISNICHLFARKFHPSALEPLLKIAPALFKFNTDNTTTSK